MRWGDDEEPEGTNKVADFTVTLIVGALIALWALGGCATKANAPRSEACAVVVDTVVVTGHSGYRVGLERRRCRS